MTGDWVVVLVKDFGDAKQRLGPALDPGERRALARRNAERAITAAEAGPNRLVVAGSEEVAALARALGAQVLVEPRQEGQNPAAQRGIQQALSHGAEAVLILSSDLPLVDRNAVRGMLDAAAEVHGPVAIAAPAIGRGGTNALYLRPPAVIGLHFGGDSLALFQRDAAAREVAFLLHESPAFALDLDEPVDLARLRRAV
jgi:2-phospho-L-lactate/phosphoenolpyruvate guanylyltransferase